MRLRQYWSVLFLFWGVNALAQTDSSVYWLDKATEIQYQEPEKAYLLANKVLNRATEKEDVRLQARIHHLLGNIFHSQGAFQQSLEYYFKSQSGYLSLNDEKGVSDNLLELGRVSYYLKQENESFSNLRQALIIYQKLGAQESEAEVYGEMGHLYEKLANYDSALFYQKKALDLYQLIGKGEGLARIYENIGSIYEDLEQYPKAFKFFNDAAQLNRKFQNKVDLVSNINNLGDVYRKTKRLDSALIYSEMALALADSLELKYQLSSAYRDLAKLYYDMGKPHEAYHYLENSKDLYEEMYSQESSRQIALLQTLYEVERKNNAIDKLENEKKLEKFTRFGLISGTLAIALLGGVMISRQRLKIRKNKELIEQQKRLHQTEMENIRLNEDRLKVELEHKQLQEKHLELELETQQKSLASRMLQLIEKNKLLEGLKEGLLKINKLPEGKGKELKSLINQINYSFNHDKAWEDFRKSFEQIHQEFFDRLKKENPDLSSNDLRICALMRINLASKDIALLLGISQDSLRVARYRLRKKLNLNQKDNLRKYLLNT